MKKVEKVEAARVAKAIVDALSKSVTITGSSQAAELRRTGGALLEELPVHMAAGTIGTALLACFDLAFMAGAGLDQFYRLRAAVSGLACSTWPGLTLQQCAIRLSLVEEARALAGYTITSRSESEALVLRFNTAFDAAEELASDVGDIETFRALVALHAAVARDISARAQSLPEIVGYTFAGSLPVLWIAQRLYGDASRATELLLENRAVHPAFMPDRGRALTA